MNTATLHARDKLTLISNLATMLESGIPILEAVETLLTDSKGGVRSVLLLMKESLEQGKSISDAMQRAPRAFDKVTINIIKAAEEAGTLEDVLHDVTKTIKKDMAFTDQLRASLIYPVFVLVIFFGVLAMILTFVVPRIGKIFQSLHLPLPLPTQILMQASAFTIAYYPYILAVLAILVIGLVVLFKTRKQLVIQAVFNLPLLRTLGRQIDLARFTRSMALLLRSGIPVAEALELAKGVVIKKEILRVVDAMQKSVSAGQPMTDGIKKSKKFIPPIMLRILQTAELSGTLEKTMQELAEYFDEQVTRTLKNVTELIEPVLIVVIGLLVGGMMLSIIAPIYGIISQINAR